MQLEKGDNRPMSYTKKVMEGLGSQFAYRGVAAGLALLKLAVLARLLTPTQFGLFSLTTIALGLTEAVTETGINFTILQSKQPIKYFLDTAWVISIARGLLISAVMLMVGIFMTRYYQDNSLLPLVAVAALIPIIKGFINPSIVMMQKELRFISDSVYRSSLSLIETGAAIVLALLTHSVYALIGAMIVSAGCEVIISFIFFKDRPWFHYISARAKVIFANTKWLSLSAVLSYLQENADNLLIGKILGTTNLGFYDLSYRLSHKSHELAKATLFSTLPVYIRVKNDRARLKRAFVKTMLSTMAVLILAAVPLLFFPQLVVLVFGEQWLAALPITPILALAALLQSFSVLSYTLFLSREEYASVTGHQFASTFLMILLIIVLSPLYGLTGAAAAILLSRLLSVPIVFYGLYTDLNHA